MEIIVACPKCRYELHLPSPEYLGRKGKCPSCAHKFVLEGMPSPPAEPKPKPSVKKPPRQQPAAPLKPQSPPAESTDGKETVVATGRPWTDSVPFPVPLDAGFQQLRDPAATDDERQGVESSVEFQEYSGGVSDSAPIPEGLWDDLDAAGPPADAPSPAITPPRPSGLDVVARCPHCHGGVEFRREEELQDFPCPRCSNGFSLIHPELPAEALAMPKQVGVYPLSHQTRIGVGPFGNVYRARDGQFSEAVAIKVSRGGQVSEAERESFLTVLRLTMQLKHPGIAALHEVDAADDRVYLVSSYISGIDLSEFLTGSPDRQLSFRESASICALAASMLHHAHKFGVVHGNLKPTNIRLDGDLKPYLLDFGIGHRERAVQVTGNGRIVGSAAYLAPEQLPGNRQEPDALTDVFSLGVIFYEMLAGRRPFPGTGPELLKQIEKGSPPNPRSIKPAIPRDLDIICMKCLEPDPRDRFESAMELYKHLRLYLEDKPAGLRPPGIFTRLSRWCRRRPIMAGMLLTLLCLAIAGAGFISWRIWQTGGFS